MFDSIQLIVKKKNVSEPANSELFEDLQLAFTCELNTGPGNEKIIWTDKNPLSPGKLIRYYESLSELISSASKVSFETEFSNNDGVFNLEWTKTENNLFKISINQTNLNFPSLLLEKYFDRSMVSCVTTEFYMQVMSLATQHTNNEVAINIGALFQENYPKTNFKFKIGQKVKTIPGENVKTERTGYIISRWFHDKNNTTMYHIMVDGKRLEKRYIDQDLETIQ